MNVLFIFYYSRIFLKAFAGTMLFIIYVYYVYSVYLKYNFYINISMYK